MADIRQQQGVGNFRYGAVSTPFQTVEQQWDMPLGHPLAKAAFWRQLFIVSVIANILLAVILLLSASTPRAHLLALTVTPQGQTVTIGTLAQQVKGDHLS